MQSISRRTRSRTKEQANQSSSYQYTPLQHPDSIRLLTLCPGEFESTIQIALSEVRFREDLQYEALSCCWATEDGDSNRSSQIHCGGGKTLLVTKNCELALRYLRRPDSGRSLWVDAIAINQDDVKERDHQVQMMRDVYANATEVLIWLGETSKEVAAPSYCIPSRENDTHRESYLQSFDLSANDSADESNIAISVSEIFLKSLRSMMAEVRLYEVRPQQARKFGRSRMKRPKKSPLYQELGSQLYESMTKRRWNAYCQGFWDIVRRHWWSRVWVVQEVFVAKSATLVCSKKCIPYRDFFDWYQVLIKDHGPHSKIILRHFGSCFQHLGAYTLAAACDPLYHANLYWPFRVLSAVRSLQASNPRDKVYGILDLSHTLKSVLPTPDYNASVVAIFTLVAKTFLVQSKSLDVLYEVTTMTPVSNHSSWVPDWSQPTTYREYYTQRNFTTARKSEPISTFPQDDRELRVKGKMFDVIKEVNFAESIAYGHESVLED